MAGRVISGLTPISFVLILLIPYTAQNIRTKRQLFADQPRILTQNGHLIFQTGTNHNITFKSVSGGFINVDGEDIKSIIRKVNDNKAAISQMSTGTGSTAIPSNIASRLTAVEGRLNNLQPTGQVQTSLNNLDSRIGRVQNQVPSDLSAQLSNLGSRLSNLNPTGEVLNQLNSLRNLVQGLSTRVSSLEMSGGQGGGQGGRGGGGGGGGGGGRRRQFRRLRNRVQTLEDQMTNLQQLLTRNECYSNPCRNGGTCTDAYNGYICHCPREWQGVTCETDVNECSTLGGTDMGCQNGATCVNSPGSFSCRCTSDWHGVRCTERHDDCTGASAAALCGHGTCINVQRTQPGQPKYQCICETGWTKQGTDPSCTVDVNECTSRDPPCSQDPPVQCINVPGTFYCGTCPPGYSGNGFTCSDINECLSNNGGCSVAPRVECINTRGSNRCGPCPGGYQGNGRTCTWVGVCGVNNGGCNGLATCTESPGVSGRTCTCPSGYVGSGIGPQGCVRQGSTTGSCSSSPCFNGGACVQAGSGFRCSCAAGYTGVQCQTNINECASNPCQNGGTCTDAVNRYTCRCTSSYTGSNCQDQRESCGGYLREQTGYLSYPHDSGNTIQHGLSCAWVISTTIDKILVLTFTRFSFENHTNCRYDFLQIHDGPTASSHMIGKYCGNTLPNGGSINTTHNQIYMWLYTDASVSSTGFNFTWRTEDPVCGSNLINQNHGSISSPGYPGNYPHNRDCVWTVAVEPGNNIMFTFATLRIESHFNCSYDYLEIRDGELDTSMPVQRYCNTSSPEPFTTTGPYAWIKFHSDSNSNDKGFHITYAAVSAGPQCGGRLTQAEGILISPNYPNNYDHNAQCVWIITVQEGNNVNLTFTNFNLEHGYNCRYDYVEVRNGNDETAPSLGKFCGGSIPAPVTSTSNVVWVKFRTDGSIRRGGFRAVWSTVCGGQFNQLNGTLQSPYYPNAYPRNKNCIYIISQPQGYIISLTFLAFHLEGNTGSSCSFDYVEVWDGLTQDSPSLGRFCGSQIPNAVTTTQNYMRLRFRSDGSVQNTGFQATYTASERGCGATLTTSTGSFESPGHPNQYPHGANCTWVISVQPGLVVRLSFHTFSIEQHRRCRYDSVQIFDNSSAVAGSSLGKYCGSTVPPVTTSTDNTMTVVLRSDGSIAHSGFSASYVALNASTLCGAELTDDVGVVTSPNFPGNYPHQRECIWTIRVRQGMQIKMNFSVFQMESHPNCGYDYLEIRNGGYDTSPLIGKYCGNTIDRIMVSHSNSIWMKFKTDTSSSGRGFQMFYDGTATGCGADLTAATGSFVSPNYPLPYGHRAECFWTITVARGSKIQLSFTDFNLEGNRRCSYDYVQVRDGNSDGPELAKVCGTSTPANILSTTNRMWIKFRTDFSVSRRGFSAFYNSICSAVLTDWSGVIESPNFPNPYPHTRNCTWVIQTTRGNSINVSFSHFDIESHSSCNYDYLELRNGNSESGDLIQKLCGTALPAPLTSSESALWIKFRSDISVARNGFRLEYITNGCGGYLTSDTGTISTPGYPNQYPRNRVCVWTISVGTGKRVELNITTFDLETSTNCRFDVLEVFGGADATSPRIAQICHKQSSPQILTATGNYMFLRFKSDVSVHGTGFLATYKTLDGGCGGNYSTPTGTLLSSNYPNNYPHNTDCQWLITVSDSRTVVLTFDDFDVEGGSTCAFDYVAVYDGADQNATELMKFCGSSLPNPSIYHSSTNQMFVRMRTDSSVSKRGFKATYKTGCGGTLTASPDGVIVSPNYPATYDRLHNCTWLIQAEQSSQHVTLTFTHMEIETYRQCRKDYIIVLDGDDEDAPQIGQYCGTTIPPPITSQGSSLFVKFVSDQSVQQTGFRATYSTLTSACGGTFTAQQGTLASPGYPNNYPHDTECVWNVNVSPGNRLEVSISYFSLEAHDTCNTDYLELREMDASGRLLGRFCGNQININVTALNGLWMKFRSDSEGTAPGFVAQYNSVFGGDIIGNSGQLSSPLYPFQYPHGVNYVWTITGPVNTQIRISFAMLDIETGRRCIYDYVRFRDGGLATSPIIGKFCGTTVPPTFYSTSNQISVEFRTDLSATGNGFLLNWEAVTTVPTTPSTAASTPAVPGCGGTIFANDTVQTITSPGYPYGYGHSLNCLWTINAPVGTRIWLNITDINIEGHRTCRYDKVVVYQDNSRSTPIGTFCGRTGNTEPLVTVSNQMGVQFRTDHSVNGTGFSLDVKTVCGGKYAGVTTGQITSPGYPSPYPSNSNCTWSILVPPGRTIGITYNSFSIQSSPICSSDYLQLLNGGTESSPPLGNPTGRYCGSTTPSAQETSSNQLYVAFMSDASGSSPGFSLTFNEVQVTCGGRLTLTNMVTSGMFTSPNYPEVYPHNVECIWIITVPANERIQVDFLDNFELESSRSGCRYDYIEFREGGTENSPQISRFCGTDRPGTVWSAGNVMYVKFRTDNSIPKIGFKLQYKIATCGGTINGASGIITSPNYPQNYDNNMNCEWMINAPTGHYMVITFSSFRLQYSPNCTDADYVEIREYNSTGPLLLQACGSTMPPLRVTSDSFAYVKFISNNNRNERGFSLTFTASTQECGGDLTTPNGVISSPNFPGFYPHSRRCIWRITVARGRRITFRFTDFALEDSRFCRNDYVLLRNGFRRGSPRLAYFCGDSMPTVVESTENTMLVIFSTDASSSNGGFRAEYSSNSEATCGGDLPPGVTGNISSPGYSDGNYTNNLSCTWTITQPAIYNSTVLLEFADLELERHYACNWDKVELREGNNMNGDLLARFCGNETSALPIVSASQKLWIWFRSDISVIARGFFLTYSFKNCGGILSQSQGIITSPNYPANYNNNDACVWQIVVPEGNQINLQYTNFDIENFSNCTHDYIEIFNGKYASSPSIGKFCGNNLPSRFKSGTNNLRIVFRSDGSVTRTGFRLRYSSETAGCGGLFHGSEGYIMSPNYPQSYPHNTECVWDIRVASGYHVDLAFNPPFDLQAGGSCALDYVQVSDVSPNGTALSSTKWCANENPPNQSTSSTRMMVKFRSDASTNGNGFSANWTAECGGVMSSGSGILLSPNFPSRYENRMLCNYTILKDSQTYLDLVFDPDNFNLEGGSNCPFDYVEIYRGTDDRGRKLGRYCGTTAPQPISVLGSLFIIFKTDRSVVKTGFRATYNTSECGGNYTTPSGQLQTPTHPNRYHDNSNCTWFITVQANRVVWLKFLAFDLEAHSTCRYDYVDIYDGPDNFAPMIGHYCGNVLPGNIKTTGNSMFINFVTDSSVRRGGFRAAYETTYGINNGCGGVLNGTSGTFSSVDGDGDGNYENNLDCAWTIMVGDNKVIELTISNMNIESSGTSCPYDKLRIYDGISQNSPLIGEYCGNTSPSLITTVSNVLYVTFTTDDRNNAGGFTAQYQQRDALCGGTRIATDTPQTISSPNYPNSPGQLMNCRWTIDSGDPDKQLLFTMTTMSLQQGANCPSDYVEFRDFPMVPGGQTVHYCGTTLPQSWTSAGRNAQINFAYASGGGRRSFSMKYQIASCNRTYTGNSGVIFSPGWPGRYSNHENCEFSISAPTGSLLSFYFNVFHLESHRRCRFDYLEVFNGSDTSSGTLAKLCGNSLPNPVFTTSNTIVMRFVTDVSISKPGYSITYTASYTDMPGCGGNITGVNGSLTSPLYPSVYNDTATCNWLITSPARRTLTLTFADLTLMGTGNCQASYVVVYDGSSDRDSLIGQYCGNEIVAPRQTTGNTAFVKFVADGQNRAPAFRLTFTSR